MPLHDKAFFAMVFFLGGVFLASFIYEWPSRILVAFIFTLFIALVLLFFNCGILAVLAAAIFLGSGYYFLFDTVSHRSIIPFGENVFFEGRVLEVTPSLESQSATLVLNSPYRGKIRVTTEIHPRLAYGDVLSMEGIIKNPDQKFKTYFEKDGIYGVSAFPKITILSRNQGNFFFARLFSLKYSMISLFKSAFSPQKAALISGLTLGDTSGLSKEFKEKMSVTGTTHIVALSGYNILILARTVTFLAAFLVSRRLNFFLSIFAIFAFIAMTGAQASAVRAGIMAMILFLADQVGRRHSIRNAVTVAAFLMILLNPKLLAWDIGFQLSFAALLGIVYLEPALRSALHIDSKENGFLGWREILLTTISAQLAVLPILLTNFGVFSPLSIFANLLIILVVPLSMFLGFAVVFLGIISYFAAQVVSWLAGLFLSYEVAIIEFFAGINFTFTFISFSPIFFLLYYVGLIVFVKMYSPKLHYAVQNK